MRIGNINIDPDSQNHRTENQIIADEILIEQISNDEKRTNLIQKILSTVRQMLSQGKQVSINQDMKDLGIEKEVQSLISQADMVWKLVTMCADDDDDFGDTDVDFRIKASPFDYLD